jgi:trigger factor
MPEDELQGNEPQENGQSDETAEDVGLEAEAEFEGDESLEAKLKEAVEVDVEDVGTLRKKLTVTVPSDTLQGQIEEQYEELRREAVVPGFRKGRAPRRLLEKRFGDDVKGTLTQQAVGMGYMAAVEKTDLKTIGDPMIWVKKPDEESETLVEVEEAIQQIEMPDEGPLTFKCEVEVRPEFDLPELEGIKVTKPLITISDEDVDKQLERLQTNLGTLESIGDAAIEEDDVITADLKMVCDGETLKEQEDARFGARAQVVDGVRLEKLGEALIGQKTGDTVSVEGEIPDDYAKESARGKKAEFTFTIKSVERLNKPELTDEFAANVGFESLQELREFVKNELESRVGEEQRRAMENQVSQYLLDNTEFELPERLSNRQVNYVVYRRLVELYQQGAPPTEVEKHMDELRSSAAEDAVRDLKLQFIMEKLSDEIEVEVSEGEINAAIAGIAARQNQRFDRVRDELNKEGALNSLHANIRDRKILAELIEKAEVTESEPESKSENESK